MFTQCPECNIAFRVTAEVLKKAAGKVRCGGCGIAFDSLEYLSEEMPESAPRSQPNQRVPELTPETNDESSKSPPQTISAEQSAALLKTLDELAGSNIRIEDTGVEWRVLDEEGIVGKSDSEPESASKSPPITNTGSMKFVVEDTDNDAVEPSPDADLSEVFESPGATLVDTDLEEDSGDPIIDEILTEAPTPVDEFLSETPTPVDELLIETPDQVESTEVFNESEQHSAPEGMRFDDNTPLPEDFDLADDTPHVSGLHEPAAEAWEQAAEPESPQVDFALGDPDEWGLLLGEMDESVAKKQESIRQDADGNSINEESLYEQPQADAAAGEDVAETPLDMDTQFAIQAEAMGIDLSGLRKSIDESDGEATEIETLASRDPDDEGNADLEPEDVPGDATEIADITDSEESAADQAEGGEALQAYTDDVEVEGDDETPQAYTDDVEVERDDETLQAYADDVEVEGDDETLQVNDAGELDDSDGSEITDEIEDEDEDPASLERADDDGAEVEENADDVTESADHAEPGEPFEDQGEDDWDDGDSEELSDADEPLQAEAVDVGADLDKEAVPDSSKHYVPPQTEEEMTINMMIDQDFMRLAAEGEDLLKSTMVEDRPDIDDDPNVETIVMEGEFVHSALNPEKLAADAAAVMKRFDDPRFMEDAGRTKSPGLRGGRRATDPPSYSIIAAIVGLALLLVGQFVHEYREALATAPAFNQVFGPVYRMAGSPLTPAWDITGWRFEVTKGSTDENNELLTIYSRIGNKSDQALPYPLVHVSLTDRFEEIIGSKVLDPSEYLAGNPDPRKAVLPGNSFNAVISIEAPATQATGFKLNVCYRLASGQLRCAIEDFK